MVWTSLLTALESYHWIPHVQYSITPLLYGILGYIQSITIQYFNISYEHQPFFKIIYVIVRMHHQNHLSNVVKVKTDVPKIKWWCSVVSHDQITLSSCITDTLMLSFSRCTKTKSIKTESIKSYPTVPPPWMQTYLNQYEHTPKAYRQLITLKIYTSLNLQSKQNKQREALLFWHVRFNEMCGRSTVCKNTVSFKLF